MLRTKPDTGTAHTADPVYRMERSRILSNIMCNKRLERRGFDTRPRGWHELGSKCHQRSLAALRGNWASARATGAKP
jgi:hypothetical protein